MKNFTWVVVWICTCIYNTYKTNHKNPMIVVSALQVELELSFCIFQKHIDSWIL